MTTLTDRLFVEVDRRLSELRAESDALAARAGILLSTSAVVAALLAVRIPSLPADRSSVLAILTGVALALSVATRALALAPRLTRGPTALELLRLVNEPSADAIPALYLAKLTIVTANEDRLSRMAVLLYLQGGILVMALALAMVTALGR